MTTLEEHRRKIHEHLSEINDAIEEGIEKKPITIGFHCSACALEFLEFYLHKLEKLPLNKIIKHDWFKKPQEEQKKEPLIDRILPLEFEDKNNIYSLIYDIEEERNSLLYGKPKDEQIKKVIDKFLQLKNLIKKKLKDEEIK